MVKTNKKWRLVLGFAALVAYIFIAPRPVPRETVLRRRWISSLESNYPIVLEENREYENGAPLPFALGDRYGYLEDDGEFALNRLRTGYVSLSENAWAEYEAQPSSIQAMNARNEPVLYIENAKGYPLFLDGRTFIVGSEQNSLSALDGDGRELWTRDFPAPLTCVDAAGGFVLAGTLDGSVELIDPEGKPAFAPFAPGGSRLSAIFGCAISRNAARLAIIAGVEEQRFLLLEKSGDGYKVVYHEFLGPGFRRPAHIRFADNDNKVAYEREGGLGVFDIPSRSGVTLSLEGEISALDDSGGGDFLFAISSQGPGEKRFIAIRYPGTVAIEAPFKSGAAFLARRGTKLYLGGDSALASFELEKK